MSNWNGRSIGSSIGYMIFIFVIQYIGLWFAYFILLFVTLYYCLFSITSSQNIYSFYKTRLSYSKFKSITSVYRNYYNFGQTLIDRIASLSGKYNFEIEFEGEKYLHELAKNGQGGFMFGAHIGNWEIASHYLKRIPTTFAIVIYENEKVNIKKQIEKVGINQSVKFIYIKNDLSHIFEIAESLSHNQIICMHADRYVDGVKTISSELFGALANFPIGPWILASKFKVPVTFVFGMKESYKKYHFYASTPKIYCWEKNNIETGIKNSIAEYTLQIESKIKKYPYQWFNFFNFWNTNK
jgi:predicted LPLAT superfamily acyltransferase